MNYSSTTEQTSPGKFSSLGSSMTAAEFAKTENELNALQNEILTQGQEIEQFIQYHSSSHKSTPTFHALQVLFELFKSELSMNLTLRRSLIEEKENNQQNTEYIEKMEQEKAQFFRQISEGSSTPINEYGQVISFVIDQIKIAEKSLNHCKKRKSINHSHSKLEKENKLLASEIKQLQDDNQALRMQLHNLKTSVQSVTKYEIENQKLRNQILQIQSSNEELQAQFSLDYAKINAKADLAAQKIDSLINENQQLKEKKQNAEENLTKLSTKVSSQKDKIKFLKNEVSKFQSQPTDNTYQLKSQIDDLTQKNENLKKQIDDYQSEILNSQTSIKELKIKLKNYEELEEKFEKLKGKNEKLKIKIKKNENAVSLLQQCKDSIITSRKQTKQYKSKIEMLEKKLKENKIAVTRVEELREKIHLLEEANQKIIKNIQQQAKEQTNTVSKKLQILESKFESIQGDYSSVSTENQRLYTQLKQSAFDMQRLEAENARLTTTVERLNRDINDTKTTIWFSGKNSNDSSYSANLATREYPNNNSYNNAADLKSFPPDKSKTYYYDDENLNDEFPGNDESEIIQPVINYPSRRFKRTSKANINSGHPDTLNAELQNEMNSLQNEIESLKREMGRTD